MNIDSNILESVGYEPGGYPPNKTLDLLLPSSTLIYSKTAIVVVS